MSSRRPFRFAVQEHQAESASAWREKARLVESIGYSALYLPDHFSDLPGPIAALMAAAAATTKLRVGSLVFDNDYRHPVVLAKEAATIDLLSDGRFDLGLGAGWLTSDYEKSGIPLDPVSIRIERMEEGLRVIKGLFAGGSFSFTGKHYQIKNLVGTPVPVQKPHPPILIGGGGRRMLSLAAREADIVNINYNLATGSASGAVAKTGTAQATDEKLGWIREAAGDRFDKIELGAYIYRAGVTEDRDAVAAAFSSTLGLEPTGLLEMPHVLFGTVDQIIEDLRSRRERFGFSYVILPGDVAEDFAPVVERLAGT
jgi:probable F420-dependent oxidoreductase